MGRSYAPLSRTARLAAQTSASRAAATGTPTAPFTECPAIGGDTSCGLLIDITHAKTTVYRPSQGPYDGSDDTLLGVVNESHSTVSQLGLSADTNLFGFDGDGLCNTSPGPLGCLFGSTRYEGPNTSFSNISGDATGGTVHFTGGLAPGATAYLSLEQSLNASSVVTGGPGVSEQGGPINVAENQTTCWFGHPVNCATGTFWHEFTDVRVPGHGVPLTFQRTYSSATASVDGRLGHGWTDTYDMAVSTASSGAVTVQQENGATVTFASTGSGGFTAPPRVLASLVDNGDGTYTFQRNVDRVHFIFSAASGRLLREVDRNGYATTLHYTANMLSSVTDPAGRSLTLTYSGSHITAVTDPAGETTTFGYDASGNLTQSTDPLGRSWSFTYDASNLLLTMTDPRGGTTTNNYDASARVSRQVDAAGRATTWTYSGDNASMAGGTTTMTDPAGSLRRTTTPTSS